MTIFQCWFFKSGCNPTQWSLHWKKSNKKNYSGFRTTNKEDMSQTWIVTTPTTTAPLSLQCRTKNDHTEEWIHEMNWWVFATKQCNVGHCRHVGGSLSDTLLFWFDTNTCRWPHRWKQCPNKTSQTFHWYVNLIPLFEQISNSWQLLTTQWFLIPCCRSWKAGCHSNRNNQTKKKWWLFSCLTEHRATDQTNCIFTQRPLRPEQLTKQTFVGAIAATKILVSLLRRLRLEQENQWCWHTLSALGAFQAREATAEHTMNQNWFSPTPRGRQ